VVCHTKLETMILEPWSKRLAGSTFATTGFTVAAGACAFVVAAAVCFAAMAARLVLRPRPRLWIPLPRGLEDMISKNKSSTCGGWQLLPSRDWSRADMVRRIGWIYEWMSGREADMAT